MTTVVCLDFGTSHFKAAASTNGREPFPLPLGERDGDRVKRFVTNSSILFGRDGVLHFGLKAIHESSRGGAIQQRMDTLKRRLISGERTPLNRVNVPETFNPTGLIFSVADALALLFAHNLRLVSAILKDALDDTDGRVVYRFARPVMDAADGEWVDGELRRAIARGLSLAPAFGRSYNGSIDADHARRLLDNAAMPQPATSTQIVQKGLEEPVAAGMFHLCKEYDHRSLAAIIDIGAGTTDVAFFVAIQPNGRASVDRVRTLGRPASIPVAGDQLDALLLDAIRKRSAHRFTKHERMEVESNLRRWKEDLFKFDESVPTLSTTGKLTRILQHEFVATPEFQQTEEQIIDSLRNVLGSARDQIELFATASMFPHDYIDIVPCGGGAGLPVFNKIKTQTITSTPSHKRLGFRVKSPIPDGAEQYGDEFPQLAVALGGALGQMPRVNQ